jgi:hypothetical protein
MPADESDAELCLELTDLQAKGWLSNVKLLRRTGDVPDLDGANEIGQLAQVHAALRFSRPLKITDRQDLARGQESDIPAR